MTKEAATTFEQGIKRFPRDCGHYLEYAQMLLKLAETGDSTPEIHARVLLNTAVAIDGSLSEPHYQLGNLALRQGRTDQALEHFETAKKLNPQDSKIHYALARAYRRLGLESKATEEFVAHTKLKSKEETPSLASHPQC
jgi:Flp pilus assembly protein TadD